jgi:tRNA(fMet)-specific endonuclease VapC
VSKYLIDTNILSEPLKPTPNQNVMAKMQLYFEEIAIASVTWHEILFGCYRLPVSKKRTRIEEYLNELILSTFPILDYDAQAADWHALERKRLTAIGKPPAFADGQIAAIASVNHLVLVTNNITDFDNFDNLQLENWFAE